MIRPEFWLMVLLASTVLAEESETLSGQALYREHCQQCHGVNGEPMATGIDFRRGDGLFQPDAQLAKRIAEGHGICPSFEFILNSDEIDNVVFYLRANF